MNRLEKVREQLAYNRQVQDQISVLIMNHEMEVQKLLDSRVKIDPILERQIGVCDYFRETKYYKEGMSDQDILDRHERIEKEYEDRK